MHWKQLQPRHDWTAQILKQKHQHRSMRKNEWNVRSAATLPKGWESSSLHWSPLRLQISGGEPALVLCLSIMNSAASLWIGGTDQRSTLCCKVFWIFLMTMETLSKGTHIKSQDAREILRLVIGLYKFRQINLRSSTNQGLKWLKWLKTSQLPHHATQGLKDINFWAWLAFLLPEWLPEPGAAGRKVASFLHFLDILRPARPWCKGSKSDLAKHTLI
jgi:hypothetical protein